MYGVMFYGFTVRCPRCHYETQPARKPREGIRKVLSGEAIACRKCGAVFTEIHVPARPLVRNVERELGFVALTVKIVSNIPPTDPARAMDWRE